MAITDFIYSERVTFNQALYLVKFIERTLFMLCCHRTHILVKLHQIWKMQVNSFKMVFTYFVCGDHRLNFQKLPICHSPIISSLDRGNTPDIFYHLSRLRFLFLAYLQDIKFICRVRLYLCLRGTYVPGIPEAKLGLCPFLIYITHYRKGIFAGSYLFRVPQQPSG